MKELQDNSKFIFSETFNNKSGKTSGSGFIGVILGLVVSFAVLCGVAGFFMEIENTIEFLEITVKLTFAVSILLGARKVSEGFTKDKSSHYNKP